MSKFFGDDFDKRQIQKNENGSINHFLLENNLKQIDQICEFLDSKFPLMLINGFVGTGKASVVKYTASFLLEDVIKLEYNCFETTILDDILLSFFEDFKNLTMQDIIHQPKVKTENFTQKIASYFNSINLPIVIILNFLFFIFL